MDGTRSPKKTARLKAATMLESVLALGLLAAASSIAVVIHQRTLATSRAFARMAAWSATERLLGTDRSDALPADMEVGPGLHVHLEVTALGKGLEQVRMTCTDHDRVLLERRILRAAP